MEAVQDREKGESGLCTGHGDTRGTGQGGFVPPVSSDAEEMHLFC